MWKETMRSKTFRESYREDIKLFHTVWSKVWLAFFLVVLPLSLPGLATVAIFSFLLSWTDYTFGLIIISSDINKTLPVGLATMVSAHDLNWGDVLAGAFLISVPLLLMLTFVSKYFVKGLTAGAMKG